MFNLFRSLSLALVVCNASCGGDDSSGSLQSALDGARASLGRVCDKVRACYPDIQDEEDFCSIPDSGGTLSFQSDWPDVEADSCWDPVYKAHPSAVLDFLNCHIEANNAYRDCLANCPEETDDCISQNDDEIDHCEDAFLDIVGVDALENYDACEKSKLPDDEDEI